MGKSKRKRELQVTSPILSISSPSASMISPLSTQFRSETESSQHNNIPMPPVEELNMKFDLLLEDLNIGDEKKDLMRMFTVDRKWLILRAHLQEQREDTEYLHVIEELKLGEQSLNLLSNLSVSLRSKPIRWIAKFIENDGLVVLLEYLQRINETRLKPDHEELCIRCLKSLMNNKLGLESVLQHPESIFVITCCLKSRYIRAKGLVLEMLAAVCMISGGHRSVLDAMSRFTVEYGERFRFETVVNCFGADLSHKGDDKFDRLMELQAVALLFINAVICGGPGKDSLEFRMHVRFEFLRLGIDRIVDRVSSFTDNETLQNQLNVYLTRFEEDETESALKLETKLSQLDTSEPESLFKAVNVSLKNSEAYFSLATILRSCLLFPNQPVHMRSKYWLMLAEFARQLSLQKDSQQDPDIKLIKLDIESLVGELVDEEQLKKSEAKAKQMIQSAAKAKEELDVQKDTFVKNLARLEESLRDKSRKEQDLHAQISAYQQEIQKLKTGSTGSQEPHALVKASNIPPAPPLPTTIPIAPPMPTAPPPGPNSNLHANNSGSIPPPPPPPPNSSSVQTGSVPPPPPPPGSNKPAVPPAPGQKQGSLVPTLPPKKNKLSSKPLRPLQWVKINNIDITNTIWKEMDDNPVHQQMDYSEFENLFATGIQSSKTRESSEIQSPNSDFNLGQDRAVILDSKRAQTINILIKSLKLSGDEVKRAVLECDMDALKPHVVTELLKIIPTSDEIQLLQQLTVDNVSLTPAEQFMWDLSQIDRYSDRIRALHSRCMFQEWYDDAKQQVDAWTTASAEIETSRKLRLLLQIVLAFGNYLNSGPRGGAYGFKLETLLKLCDVRSTVENRKHTLLHFMVDVIDTRFPEADGWQEEIKSCETAAKIDLSLLRKTMVHMRTGLKDAQRLMESLEDEEMAPDDFFLDRMKEWITPAQHDFELVDTRMHEVDLHFKDLCKMFAEDPKTTQPQDFFGKFNQFIAMFNNSRAENILAIQKQQELEKRERDRSERLKTVLRRRSVSIANRKLSDTAFLPIDGGSPIAENQGEFDDLISSIKTGKAFFNQGFAPQRRQRTKSSQQQLSPTEPSAASRRASDASERPESSTKTAPKPKKLKKIQKSAQV